VERHVGGDGVGEPSERDRSGAVGSVESRRVAVVAAAGDAIVVVHSAPSVFDAYTTVVPSADQSGCLLN
jgi:hypothetical protein